MKIILASASPRRKQLLAEIVKDFSICVSNAEEIADMSNPTEGVKVLSQIKAESVFQKICMEQHATDESTACTQNNDKIQNSADKQNFKIRTQDKSDDINDNRISVQNDNKDITNKFDPLVIGADTIVVLNGKVLGKPKDENQAREMLQSLSGKTHKVITGVTVKSKTNTITFAEESSVTFKKLDERQITEYIKSGSPFDKAGAYGIQDSGFVAEIKGSYKNVMGLPVERLTEILQTYGG